MKYYMLMENQVKRCITMLSIGSTNMLKESNPFWRVFFMFKDFTLRATHTQSLCAVDNREADDYLAMIYSMATNTEIVTGLAYLHSKLDYNKNNQYKHKKYMEEYLNPKALGYIALMRSSVLGSALSPLNDVLEATDSSPLASIRTTTNRYKRNKGTNERVGDYLIQLPAIKTGTDFIGAGKDAMFKDKYTQEDFKKLMALLPDQNFILMLRLRYELAERTGLPKEY